MRFFAVENWLKAPADRDVIARWTRHDSSDHYLLIPQPPHSARFEFLALGDTGDSESAGHGISPQDAVAKALADDSALPNSHGKGRLVLHTGDVVYMTGERRLYDRNFRRPYQQFLTPESTVDDLVFQLPFLPVPGNHDYYDLGGWATWLARVPFLGAGLRALSHQLFAFGVPEGGSDMGRAYIQAFIEPQPSKDGKPLSYRPGVHTRLPNRYYKFRFGSVDFFALDSNTLEGPPPSDDTDRIRSSAAEQVDALRKRAGVLDRQLRREELALERWQRERRERISADPDHLAAMIEVSRSSALALANLGSSLEKSGCDAQVCEGALNALATAERRWAETAADLSGAAPTDRVLSTLERLEEACGASDRALRALEGCLAILPECPARTDILKCRDAVEQAVEQVDQTMGAPPKELCSRLWGLSEDALEIQRELALEDRRARYRPEDYDIAQIEWLARSLDESIRERPDAWRVVYLHHPLSTTIGNHCEGPDVRAMRENLMRLLENRAHLVLSGHSHAFEWIRSRNLNTGFFVTGGGGQITLRRSILDPRLLHRRRERYAALRSSGVVECAVGGRGPAASDGQSGPIYHYLKIEVSPEALRVRPIGIRRIDGGFRREAPMPVFHAPILPETRPAWIPRILDCVEVTRDRPPVGVWK